MHRRQDRLRLGALQRRRLHQVLEFRQLLRQPFPLPHLQRRLLLGLETRPALTLNLLRQLAALHRLLLQRLLHLQLVHDAHFLRPAALGRHRRLLEAARRQPLAPRAPVAFHEPPARLDVLLRVVADHLDEGAVAAHNLPVVRPVLAHRVAQLLVLLLGPRALDEHIGIRHVLGASLVERLDHVVLLHHAVTPVKVMVDGRVRAEALVELARGGGRAEVHGTSGSPRAQRLRRRPAAGRSRRVADSQAFHRARARNDWVKSRTATAHPAADGAVRLHTVQTTVLAL
mmetsp:Transcript_14543/g.50660  ORF Transcript_14543/g.50660 Transcript_14543/m.50660 type:complete len:286 (-) Transcript_14543:9-866(-)